MERLLFNPISNVLIEKYFNGKANIKELEEIRKCNTIDDFFDKHDHVIIFLRNKSSDVGHWVTLFTNNNKCYFIDSYGYAPIKILNEINPDLIPYADLMNNLIKQKYKDYYFSDIHYQDDDENIATCGRYAVLVCIFNKILKNFNFDMFYNIINNFKKKNNMNADETVCYFINKLDKY